MSDIAIRVENLSKRYRIGLKEERPETFVGAMAAWLKSPLVNFRQLRQLSHFSENGHDPDDVIWALKDVSFEVGQGEVVGIIGPNGAGKSTLLKILSRITEPSSGRAVINGRVSSLLEVGTGFHPELTGRENVYLNGTILGMSRLEVDRKFEEIVEFSGVAKFIDTPVKHYSSGMQVRLAFAVAAHLEPEILLIDEVLAVGDAAFQKKCLGQMEQVAQEGRTVLFVSHQMSAVKQLCDRCLLVNSGQIQQDGPTDEVMGAYISATTDMQTINLAERTDRDGGKLFRFISAKIMDSNGRVGSSIPSGEATTFMLDYESPKTEPLRNVSVAIHVEDLLGRRIFTLATLFTGEDYEILPPTGTLTCHIPALPLVAGEYKIFLWALVNGELGDKIFDAMRFFVEDSNVFGAGKSPTGRQHGPVYVLHSWRDRDSRPIPSNVNGHKVVSQKTDRLSSK